MLVFLGRLGYIQLSEKFSHLAKECYGKTVNIFRPVLSILSRHILWGTVLLCLVCLSFFNCRSEKDKQADEKITLQLMVWARARELGNLRTGLAEEFEPRYPNVQVEVVPVPGPNYATKLTTMLAAGLEPDLFMIHDNFLPTAVDNKLLLPLDEFVAKDPELDLADYYPEVVDLCRYNGRLYCMPVGFSVVMLYYNKELFDDAGLEYPDENWTWDDMHEAARKLTIPRGKDGRPPQYGLDGPGKWLDYFMFIWQNGGRVFDEKGKLVMGNPANLDAATEAWQFVEDLTWNDKLTPSLSSAEVLPADPFIAGQIAMVITGTWKNNTLAAMGRDARDGAPAIRWGMAPMPKKKQRATLYFGGSPVISANTEHPEEAYQLLKFFTSDAWQKRVAESARQIPARIDIAESDVFLKLDGIPDDVDMRQALDALPYARRQPNGRETAEILSTWLMDFRDSVAAGEVDNIRQSIKKMQETYDARCPYCSAQR